MSYLASSLGHVEGIDSSPVTDDNTYLLRFSRSGVPEEAMRRQLDSLRVQILDRVLPVPRHSVEPFRIRAFKERYRHELGDFRRRVERELVEAANIIDPALRQQHLDIFVDEAETRIREIEEAMSAAGWETAKAGYAVLAAVPGVSPLFGLAGAVWNAVAGGHRHVSRDFAYAAHARHLLEPRTRVS